MVIRVTTCATRYICAFYDDLPRLSVFLHGHETSWHHRRKPTAAEQLRRLDLRGAAQAGGVYLSFNDYQECWREGSGEWERELVAQVWNNQTDLCMHATHTAPRRAGVEQPHI